MGKRGNSNVGAIAIVALIAFAAGKMSGDDGGPDGGTGPQALVTPVADGSPAAWSYAETDAPDPAPDQFVSTERQSAFGSAPFRNCSHARAAGAAPVHAGDAGYGPHLDRDSDGVGCE
ncbi:excalibur calcium-binding domain-containing protein [Sphingopyxis sp.]|uniref:excalibur calcium-binding domain-containing protein n=1 Tax=Sphingopyxis sp. TaxID=1908224 RepID=UPI0025D852BC|nr:excalibur calcium-binding domain-containing protein [Sphingopyxis sp.]